MDRNGIGTDATIAAHIKTIQVREYALKNHQGHFIPTNLGLALVEGYLSPSFFFLLLLSISKLNFVRFLKFF